MKLVMLLLCAELLVIPDWETFRKGDPVLEFCERVNNRAVARPDWHRNYTYAHYYAFVDEANAYALEKYKKSK
jgi:hypothetical protein